ncbi:uncharacterized protein ASCRUDRAFT_76056 [Ascoidea rubescens DSM 1968]|uniref:Uncharacterized protein n=1 Tax=Ascoidea rubescens DSM 1968 TaxID=1344418 RepID=A0A1D2VGF3_9ASCO|nr:hypothetical protein ASCRUDRAFT_76056 [Ascoidea rubescens DSM 1968]ODV60679.1 hypothetical protein ASCRUDRAFT_76056 [Ascoidea rubescens DSM 1968]
MFRQLTVIEGENNKGGLLAGVSANNGTFQSNSALAAGVVGVPPQSNNPNTATFTIHPSSRSRIPSLSSFLGDQNNNSTNNNINNININNSNNKNSNHKNNNNGNNKEKIGIRKLAKAYTRSFVNWNDNTLAPASNNDNNNSLNTITAKLNAMDSIGRHRRKSRVPTGNPKSIVFDMHDRKEEASVKLEILSTSECNIKNGFQNNEHKKSTMKNRSYLGKNENSLNMNTMNSNSTGKVLTSKHTCI